MDDVSVRIGGVRYQSLDDGPGRRTVLWIAGCSLRCPGFNPELWSKSSGQVMTLETVQRALDRGRALGDMGVTFVGGEPLDQPQVLAELCEYVRDTWPQSKTLPRLVIYSGYTFEELRARNEEAVSRALLAADVLVDGRFVQAFYDGDLAYRGSRNQRPIDLPRTFEAGRVVILAWDRPRITIHSNGVAVMSPGVARLLGISATPGRHCGQHQAHVDKPVAPWLHS